MATTKERVDFNDPNTYLIDIEPSWRAIAEIAIGLIESGEPGKESGRKIIRDMGEKLAKARENQKKKA